MKENTEVFDDCLVVQYSDLKASFSTSFFLLFCNIIIIAVYSLFLKKFFWRQLSTRKLQTVNRYVQLDSRKY